MYLTEDDVLARSKADVQQISDVGYVHVVLRSPAFCCRFRFVQRGSIDSHFTEAAVINCVKEHLCNR